MVKNCIHLKRQMVSVHIILPPGVWGMGEGVITMYSVYQQHVSDNLKFTYFVSIVFVYSLFKKILSPYGKL